MKKASRISHGLYFAAGTDKYRTSIHHQYSGMPVMLQQFIKTSVT